MAPAHARHRLVEGLIDRLRRVTPAFGAEGAELGVHGVEVVREVEEPRDVTIAAIAIADQADPDLRSGLS